MEVRGTALSLSVLVLALLFTNPGQAAEKKEVVLGFISAFTGAQSVYGERGKQGADMAAEEINATGGVNGARIRIVYEDDKYDPTQSVNMINKLIYQDKVFAIIGPQSSSACFATAPIAEKEKVPEFVNGTNPKLTKQGFKWVFRPRHSDDTQAELLTEFAVKQLGFKKIGIFFVNHDFGVGGRDVVVETLKALGLQPVSVQAHAIGDKNFTAQILNFQKAKPDAIVAYALEQEGALFVKQLRQQRWDVPVFGANTMGNPTFLNLAGASAEHEYSISPFIHTDPDPRVSAFVKKYKEKYSVTPDFVSAHGYDAVQIVAKAFAVSGPDREKFREAVLGIKDFQGLQGRFDYTRCKCGDGLFEQKLIQVKNGDYVPVGLAKK
jgi:branched-chain amino acid transport system substrate-binding protein